MALVKRSPKMTANWAFAMDHSRGAIFHSFSERFKTRNKSFIAAESVGKWPLARTARRSLAFRASIAFVAFEPIDDGEQDIVDAAVAELVHDPKPKLGT